MAPVYDIVRASASSVVVKLIEEKKVGAKYEYNSKYEREDLRKKKREDTSDYVEENKCNLEAEVRAYKKTKQEEAEKKEFEQWWKRELERPVHWKKLMIMRYAKFKK